MIERPLNGRCEIMDLSLWFVAGCFIILYGSYAYIRYYEQQHEDDELPKLENEK